MPIAMLMETQTTDTVSFWLFADSSIILWGEEPQVTFNLFDLTYRVGRESGTVDEGIATGGSTTTIIDTNALDQDDDYWNKGTAWIIRDSAGASAAPEGEYSVISDFATSTDTATLQDTLTAAVASGDRYAVGRKQVPLHIIIQKINQVLIDLGVVPYTDTTSVVMAANQTEYTLPVAASHDLREVWLQMDNTDADDNLWVEIFNWVVEKSDRGVADTLILPLQYSKDYYLKLVYMAKHPSLYASTDKLSEHVPLERVVFPAVLDCLRWRKQRTRQRTFDDDIERWEEKVELVRQSSPVQAPSRPGKIFTLVAVTGEYDDEPNKVYL